MKRIGILLLLLILTAGLVDAAVSWKGASWDTYGSLTLEVTGEDYLKVTPVGTEYAAAHYNTPQAFRNSLTPCIELSFVDDGTTGPRAQIWVEKEGTPNAAWFQFGTWETSSNYRIYWWNVDTDSDGWVDAGTRSVGEHTLKIGKRSDGTVDFYVDGILKHSTTNIAPAYFGDVYLAAKNGPSVFTDYKTCTDYAYHEQESVPEFGIIGAIVASTAILGIVLIKRNN